MSSLHVHSIQAGSIEIEQKRRRAETCRKILQNLVPGTAVYAMARYNFAKVIFDIVKLKIAKLTAQSIPHKVLAEDLAKLRLTAILLQLEVDTWLQIAKDAYLPQTEEEEMFIRHRLAFPSGVYAGYLSEKLRQAATSLA